MVVYAGPAIEEKTLMARAALAILATFGWLTVLPAGVAARDEQRALALVIIRRWSDNEGRHAA